MKTHPNAPSLQDRLDAMIHDVEHAYDQARSGVVTPMDTLEHSVNKLCADIQYADPGEAAALKTTMGEMITKLDMLVDTLKTIPADTSQDPEKQD